MGNLAITIRPVSLSDSSDILEGLLKGDLSSAVPGSEDVRDLDKAKYMVADLIKRAALSAELHFSVCLGAKVIGMCALYGFDEMEHSSMIGYWISKPYRGKGYASSAVKMLIDTAFHEVGLTKLYASSDQSNLASQNFLFSLGFKELKGKLGAEKLFYLKNNSSA